MSTLNVWQWCLIFEQEHKGRRDLLFLPRIFEGIDLITTCILRNVFSQ